MGCYTSVVKVFSPTPFLWSVLLRVTSRLPSFYQSPWSQQCFSLDFIVLMSRVKQTKNFWGKKLMTHAFLQMLHIYIVKLIKGTDKAVTMSLNVLWRQTATLAPLKFLRILRRSEVSVMLRPFYSRGGALQCPLNSRMCQPHCRSWRNEKEKNVCPRQKSNPDSPVVQTVTYSTF